MLCALGIVFLNTLLNGNVWFNLPSDDLLKGVDVSAHQGRIKWEQLKAQGIAFAFIKATEGSSWVDKRFATNFANAKAQGLYVGAYHFFSFESSGKTQAQNFIANVPNAPYSKALPPVVDIEFYALPNMPESTQIYKELDVLLATLEAHYKQKPIIYSTPSFYESYLKGRYTRYPLWIRSIFFAPHSMLAKIFGAHFEKDSWQFWQYHPKAVLDGYSGAERFIDLNVFNGDEAKLKAFLESSKKAR